MISTMCMIDQTVVRSIACETVVVNRLGKNPNTRKPRTLKEPIKVKGGRVRRELGDDHRGPGSGEGESGRQKDQDDFGIAELINPQEDTPSHNHGIRSYSCEQCNELTD
jgi:hypothetical protein